MFDSPNIFELKCTIRNVLTYHIIFFSVEPYLVFSLIVLWTSFIKWFHHYRYLHYSSVIINKAPQTVKKTLGSPPKNLSKPYFAQNCAILLYTRWQIARNAGGLTAETCLNNTNFTAESAHRLPYILSWWTSIMSTERK